MKVARVFDINQHLRVSRRISGHKSTKRFSKLILLKIKNESSLKNKKKSLWKNNIEKSYRRPKLGEVSFGMLKLGELGEVSFGMLKLGELGKVSFGVLKLGELGEVSFGNTSWVS